MAQRSNEHDSEQVLCGNAAPVSGSGLEHSAHRPLASFRAVFHRFKSPQIMGQSYPR